MTEICLQQTLIVRWIGELWDCKHRLTKKIHACTENHVDIHEAIPQLY